MSKELSEEKPAVRRARKAEFQAEETETVKAGSRSQRRLCEDSGACPVTGTQGGRGRQVAACKRESELNAVPPSTAPRGHL